MIKSFADRRTRDVFHGASTAAARQLPDTVLRAARRKLDMINAAASLNDLRVPPGNRLELLAGNMKGFRSIRCNQQYRIVFRWEAGNAYDVQIIDYH